MSLSASDTDPKEPFGFFFLGRVCWTYKSKPVIVFVFRHVDTDRE